MHTVARCTAALLGLTAGFLAPPAHANPVAPVSITCAVGTQTASYDPRLTVDSKTVGVRIEEQYGCTSPHGDIKSADGWTSFQEKGSCLITAEPARTDVIKYKWNTHQSSTVRFSITNVVRAGNGTTIVTSLGEISEGLGQGAHAIRVVVLPTLSVTDCLFKGVAEQTGIASLEILP
ncbi:hypothetical protein ABZ769_09180 [Streptomyces olivoreticuli]